MDPAIERNRGKAGFDISVAIYLVHLAISRGLWEILWDPSPAIGAVLGLGLAGDVVVYGAHFLRHRMFVGCHPACLVAL